MATLADILRQTGYSQSGKLSAPVSTAPTLTTILGEHIKTLPQQIETNHRAMDKTMGGMFETDFLGKPNPNYYPEAMGEFTQNYSPNFMGTFIGAGSKLWNPQKAFEAAKMLKQGVLPEEVWKTTGTTKGLENAFRQEISDEPALLKGMGNFGEIFEKRKIAHGVTTPTIEEVMRHPKLFDAYPELKGIQVQLLPETSKNNASFSPVEKIIRVNPSLPADKATSSILHELQHGIQEIEGWNKGADANTILKNYQQQLDNIDTRLTEANLQAKKAVGTPEYDKLMAIRDKISREYRELTGADIRGIYGKAMEEYKAHGGEAEARLTQTRQKLTDEERKNVYPFAKGKNALDINPEEAIIKMKHDSPTITRKELLQQLLDLNK
jgi:hypothetical protein